MLAPQFGTGVFALDLSVGHIGTSVPVLLVWLLLDKAPPRLWVPVLTAFLLAWVLVADPIVYVVAIGPLGLVCALRVLRGVIKGSGGPMNRIADQWYDLSLGGAVIAATAMAWVFNKLLSEAGGYTVNRLPFYLTPWHDLHTNLSAIWKVLEIFGLSLEEGIGTSAFAYIHPDDLERVATQFLALLETPSYTIRDTIRTIAAGGEIHDIDIVSPNALDKAVVAGIMGPMPEGTCWSLSCR